MFKFNWRIENVIMCAQNVDDKIQSPIFEIETMDNKRASIWLYPRKLYLDYTGRTVCCGWLCFENSSETFEVGTKITFSITKNRVSRSEQYIVNSLEGIIISKDELRHVIKEIDSLQDLFINKDILDIECLIQKPNTSYTESPVTCYGKTVALTESHSYDLPLVDFFSYESWKQLFNTSKNFFSATYRFKLNFVRKGMYNIMVTNETKILPVCICIKLSLMNENEEIELTCNRHFFKTADCWEQPFLMSEYMKENFTFLRWKIIVSKGNTASNLCTYSMAISAVRKQISDKPIPEKPIPTNKIRFKSDQYNQIMMKNMYETKMYSDVILQVDNQQFTAHKCVLCTVSDVFAAMFANNMKEKESSVVNITDIDSDVISKMLEFIYTSEIENLKRESLGSLYAAADKYQILELKKLCSDHLSETLNIDNCLEILELADMFQDSLLEGTARKFVYANRKIVSNSDRWKLFMKKNIELAADIMFHTFKDQP